MKNLDDRRIVSVVWSTCLATHETQECDWSFSPWSRCVLLGKPVGGRHRAPPGAYDVSYFHRAPSVSPKYGRIVGAARRIQYRRMANRGPSLSPSGEPIRTRG